MFNTSIETSIFTDSLKIARVTPIYKNGDKADKSNYRPISVLPVISRLFEKLVLNQVYQHMEDNGLFSCGQSAYLRLHYTVTQLLKNTDDWYNGLDLGKLVQSVTKLLSHSQIFILFAPVSPPLSLVNVLQYHKKLPNHACHLNQVLFSKQH